MGTTRAEGRWSRRERWTDTDLVRVGAVLGGLLVITLVAAKLFTDLSGRGDEGDLDGGTAQSSIRSGELEVTGWANERRVHRDDTITFWLSAVNRGTAEVASLRLAALDAPGFETFGDCWWPAGCQLPACTPQCGLEASPGVRDPAAPVVLQPGEGIDYRAELRAVAVEGGESLSAVFEWTADSNRERVVLFIGPFRRARETDTLHELAGSFYEFFKDLGLPIALGLLAYLFQRLQAVRARRDQTYDSMLPRAHENAVRYLIPMTVMAGMIDRAVGAAERAEAAGKTADRELAWRRAFYYLLLLLKNNATLLERGGGYFLTSLEGENVGTSCWNALFRRVVQRLDYAALYKILDGFELEDSMTRFEDRFCIRNRSTLGSSLPSPPPVFTPVFTQARKAFREWLGEDGFHDEIRRLLRLYSHVILFEVNRLYHLWYAEPDREGEERLLAEIDAIPWASSLPAAPPARRKTEALVPNREAGSGEPSPRVSEELIELEARLRAYARTIRGRDRGVGGWLGAVRWPSSLRLPNGRSPDGRGVRTRAGGPSSNSSSGPS